MPEVERSILHTNTPEYILVTSLFANYQFTEKVGIKSNAGTA